MTGTSASASSPPSISITPFNTMGGQATLTTVRLASTSSGTFGGTVLLGNPSGSRTFSFAGKPSFSFGSGSINQTITGNQVAGKLDGNPTTTVVGTAFVNATASGSYPGTNFANSSVAVTTPTLAAYFSGSPVIDFYRIDYLGSYVPSGGTIGFDSTTFSGQFSVVYEYDYQAVPAPSAIAGSAAAFAYIRRLKGQSKRLRSFSGAGKG